MVEASHVIRSSGSAVIRRVLLSCLLPLWCLLPGTVHASRMLEIMDLDPIVVEGGVLAIPIRCLEPDSSRIPPEQVTLRLDQGDVLKGLVTWLGLEIDSLPSGDGAEWTRSFSVMRAAPFPERRALRATARGYVLCEVPIGYRGAIRIGRQVVQPRWLDPLPELAGPVLSPAVGNQWPALDDPGAWWRWTLIAESDGKSLAMPNWNVRESLLARHGSDLWRAGLARMRRISPGAAAELRELLVATCTTSDQRTVATWITDPTELKVLLDLMLDMRRKDDLIVRSVLSYLDARFPLIAWVELETGTRARIAIANPTDGEQVLRMQWLEGDPIPSAAVIPPSRIIEVDVDRPSLPERRSATDSSGDSLSNQFILTVDRMQHRLSFAAERIIARPPGVRFGPFLRPLGLAEAWSGDAYLPPEAWATSATLRKRAGQWEIFLECFRDPTVAPARDQVEIFLGPPEVPVRVIRAGSDSSLEFFPDGARFQGASLRIRSFADRWRGIVVLDPELVAAAGLDGSETLQIGLRRLRDGRLLSVAGAAVPPWNTTPPTYLVELSQWGEILPSGPSVPSPDDASLYSGP